MAVLWGGGGGGEGLGGLESPHTCSAPPPGTMLGRYKILIFRGFSLASYPGSFSRMRKEEMSLGTRLGSRKVQTDVANKLFITCVFNPVRLHTWLTALSALLRLLNALICPKRSRQALSVCGGTESTYNTVVVDVGPAGSVGCVARVPSKTRLDSLKPHGPLLTGLVPRLSCMTIKFLR